MIDLIPIMGNLANAYMPILLIILCAMNVFNVWTKVLLPSFMNIISLQMLTLLQLLGACCIKRFRLGMCYCLVNCDRKFSYDEEFTDERIDQGKDIIATGT